MAIKLERLTNKPVAAVTIPTVATIIQLQPSLIIADLRLITWILFDLCGYSFGLPELEQFKPHAHPARGVDMTVLPQLITKKDSIPRDAT